MRYTTNRALTSQVICDLCRKMAEIFHLHQHAVEIVHSPKSRTPHLVEVDLGYLVKAGWNAAHRGHSLLTQFCNYLYRNGLASSASIVGGLGFTPILGLSTDRPPILKIAADQRPPPPRKAVPEEPLFLVAPRPPRPPRLDRRPIGSHDLVTQ